MFLWTLWGISRTLISLFQHRPQEAQSATCPSWNGHMTLGASWIAPNQPLYEGSGPSQSLNRIENWPQSLSLFSLRIASPMPV
jgi:hypothetical protein